MLERLLPGLILSSLIAAMALRRGSLSRSGAVASLFVGSACYLGGGARFFAVLLTFFLTSTLLGRIGKTRKAETKQQFSKSDTRDALQVASNGGVAALAAVLCFYVPNDMLGAAFLGALAAANADTWATELGVLSRREPWSLVQWGRVPRGTSGAVSPLGLAATLGGSALIAAIGTLPYATNAGVTLTSFVSITLAGCLGSLMDSLLGATLQSGYHCARCDRATEGPVHHCGERTRHVRGLSFVGNDLVNVGATLTGALAAAVLS